MQTHEHLAHLHSLHAMPEKTIIPARTGAAFTVPSGATMRITTPSGTQVVDLFAFAAAAPRDEHLSMAHTRAALTRLTPRVGDTLTSSRRARMLTVVADSTPGVHDTLIAACDAYRYQELGVQGWHASCAENLERALEGVGVSVPFTPAPFNLFMNIPVREDGTLSFEEPVTGPGEYIEMRAEMDLIVVCSACPQDILSINKRNPTEAVFEVL